MCLPSRASMLTGCYPGTIGQFGFQGYIPRRFTWMQEYFKRAGYTCAAVGKFHIGCLSPDQWTFDFSAPSLPEDEVFAIPPENHYRRHCEQAGVSWPTDQIHGHNPAGGPLPTASTAPTDICTTHRFSWRSDVPEAHSLERWTTDKAIEFLDWSKQEREGAPFFAWVTYDRPHLPTTLPADWFDKITPESIHLHELPTREDLLSMSPVTFRSYAEEFSRFTRPEDAFRFVVATYYCLINYLDEQIGRLLSALDAHGLTDSTTIVFTSDHGDEAGYRGLYNKHPGISSEEIVRVPLIIKPAGTPASGHGIPSSLPVELTDLFPTLCDLAGVAVPDGLDGLSAAEAFRPDNLRVFDKDEQCCQSFEGASIVAGGMKLVFDSNESCCELFDLRVDTYCFRNLYSNPEHLADRVQLKSRLLRFLAARAFGSPTEADFALIDALIEGRAQWTELDVGQTVTFFRAAALLGNSEFKVIIFFSGREPLRFPNQLHFPTIDTALPDDACLTDHLLSKALVEMIHQQPRLSALTLRKPGSVPTPERVDGLSSR